MVRALHLETGSSDIRSLPPLAVCCRGHVRRGRCTPCPPWGSGSAFLNPLVGPRESQPAQSDLSPCSGHGRSQKGGDSSANGLFLTLSWGTASALSSLVASEGAPCRQVGQMSLASDSERRQMRGGRGPKAKRGCLALWPDWPEVPAGTRSGLLTRGEWGPRSARGSSDL